VTDSIQVTSPNDVCKEVLHIYSGLHSEEQFTSLLQTMFNDFTDLYTGHYPGYHACDTLYHDIHHSLDVTLAMARLMGGYEQQNPRKSLGEDRFILGIACALFHDSGLIRREEDTAVNGAMYMPTHVQRSGEFLSAYLESIGLKRLAKIGTRLLHFTGYEIKIANIDIHGIKDRELGNLLGTADLIAQMADRCYLEKCRDRLFPEFVLGGMTDAFNDAGGTGIETPEDLLRQTPQFFRDFAMDRLENQFKGGYRYASAFFKGKNPYMEEIYNNLVYIDAIIEAADFSLLRRIPPKTAGDKAFPYHLLPGNRRKRSAQ